MNCPSCDAAISNDAAQCPACGAQVDSTFFNPERAGDAEILQGQWQIEKKLGQGGMGSVFLAHDLSLGRKVAIKMLSIQLADNAELVARFEREARMMARLDHPNLVPVYAVGRREKTPFIVMKFLEGQSLGDYLAEHQRLTLSEVLPIIQELSEGLQFVHDNGVVHRDLKPANVFVSPTGHVTLLDLGVARDTEQNMTRTGMLVGTPRYMSPEQILGKRVGHTSDLYSLGTLVFEMLTGAPVFEGESDFSLMKAHVDQAPPDLASLATVPPEVNAVLQRALAKEPEARFQSAREFFEALAAAAQTVAKSQVTRPPAAPTRPSLRATPAPRGPTPAPRGPTPPPSKFKPASRPPSAAREGPRVIEPTLIATRKTDPAGEADLDASALAAARPSKLPLIGVLLALLVVVLAGVLYLKPWEPGSTEPVAHVAQPPAPIAKVEVAPEKVEAPPEKVEVPPEKVEAPPEKVEAPPEKVEPPPEKIARKAPHPTPVERKPLVAREAPVTFLFRVKGQNVAAFVDVDGIRQRTTPLQLQLAAGKHSVSFVSEGRPPEKREITVVGGEPLKVLVEVAQ